MKIDHFSLQTVDAANEWQEIAESCDMVALAVAEERPDLADVFTRFAESFRTLEGLTVELLGIYTDEHGGAA